MKQWHMIIDVAKCEGCNNCMLACKDEHVDNDWPGYSAPQSRHGHRRMSVARTERGQFPLIDVAYRPTPCMHCEDAPCASAARGAVKQRPDGVVLIDPIRAKGNRHLAEVCPYGAIGWNEEHELPQKCTFCAHLLDKGWKQPRCVQACPTGALRTLYAEPGEMRRVADAEKLSVLHPEFNTYPHVYYANLFRFDDCFIAGSVALDADRITDCVAGAKVILKRGHSVVAETLTNAFGDFKFDGLKKTTSSYTLEISVPDLDTREITVAQLTSSVNVGTICFTSATQAAAST